MSEVAPCLEKQTSCGSEEKWKKRVQGSPRLCPSAKGAMGKKGGALSLGHLGLGAWG